MTRYAEGTSVPVERSRAEIEKLLSRYGASSFMSGFNPTEAVIAFEARGRRIMFRLPMPPMSEFEHTPNRRRRRNTEAQRAACEQAVRQRWRALALAIKAKLEAVETGITTFEDEFMAHIVMPDGMTVGQHLRPRIAQAYKDGNMPPMLPDYSGGKQ